MEQATKDRLSDRNIWTRGLYMLFYVVAYAVAETLLTLIVIFQFVAALVTGSINLPLQQFGANLTGYAYQIFQFATFNSELKPFPFADWPQEPLGDTPWAAQAREETTADTMDAASESPAADEITIHEDNEPPISRIT